MPQTDAHDRGASDERARRVALRAWATVGCLLAVWLASRALVIVWPAVELLIVGVVVGFVCSPITNWLEGRGVGRALAALASLLLVLLVASLVFVLLGPPFMSQLLEVLQRTPVYVSQLRATMGRFWESFGSDKTVEVQQSLDQFVTAISNLGLNTSSELVERLSSGIVRNAVSAVGGLFTLFLGLVLGYWFAKDYPRIARELMVIAGPAHGRDISVLLAVMSRSVGGYMRGVTVTSLVGGLLAFVGYALMGHPYAGLMAIAMGVFHFVPVVGPWIASALVVLLALSVSPVLALEALLVSVVVQNLTDNVVSPLVMQSSVKVHPALSLLGIVIGNALGGVLGMALAIPLTAAARSVFVYFFESKSGRQLVSYDGALFRSTPFRDEEGRIEPSFDALDDDRFFESTRLVSPEGLHAVRPEPRPDATGVGLGARVQNVARRAMRGRSGADGEEK
ncbi:AI-2E family transporter [uncultured Olsenella sp.]|uniref:AI-2E family transporter n=1 Tax=uncultured Olsenella sp. TaxID=190764 RepID=UPI0026DD9DA4|nr:AI-2E family transporter [uncultured Olsenella sp.]